MSEHQNAQLISHAAFARSLNRCLDFNHYLEQRGLFVVGKGRLEKRGRDGVSAFVDNCGRRVGLATPSALTPSLATPDASTTSALQRLSTATKDTKGTKGSTSNTQDTRDEPSRTRIVLHGNQPFQAPKPWRGIVEIPPTNPSLRLPTPGSTSFAPLLSLSELRSYLLDEAEEEEEEGGSGGSGGSGGAHESAGGGRTAAARLVGGLGEGVGDPTRRRYRSNLTALSRQARLGREAKEWEVQLELSRQRELQSGQVALRAQADGNPLLFVNDLIMPNPQGRLSSVSTAKYILSGLFAKRLVSEFDVRWTTPLAEPGDDGEWSGHPRLASPELDFSSSPLTPIALLPSDRGETPSPPPTPPPSPWSPEDD